MKLEIGMFVRTKEFGIRKLDKKVEMVDEKGEKLGIIKLFDNKYGYFKNDNMFNYSHNIIDLIEVGDYVNGYIVDEIVGNNIYIGDENYTLAYKFNYDKVTIHIDNIKSIVTKEQFKSMEYVIEEEI